MHEIDLSAGPIAYEDTAGPGPVVVLLHGLAMDGSVWSQVVQELRPDHRCLVPTMPLGSHRKPMRADADLSASGIAKLVAELLQALDLREVTWWETMRVCFRSPLVGIQNALLAWCSLLASPSRTSRQVCLDGRPRSALSCPAERS